MMLEIAERLHPQSLHVSLGLAWLSASLEEKEKALKLIKTASVLHEEVVNTYALLGMKDEAIQAIEKGISRGMKETSESLFPYLYLTNNPELITLREDDRFKALLSEEYKKHKQYLQLIKIFNFEN